MISALEAKEVWESYRATIEDMGIHSIPLFAFSLEGQDRRLPTGPAWRIHGAQGRLGTWERHVQF